MAHGAIRWQIELHVVRIGGLGIISVMATVAGIRGTVEIPVVTGITIAGNGNVRPGKRINRVMIEGRRHPGRFRMAQCAIGGELGCGMVWIAGLGVFGIVAAVAGIGRIVVIAVVAGSTIRCNGSMCAVQGIIRIVNRESSGFPAGCGGMAHSAIRGEIQRLVFRIGCLNKIRIVASIAGIRGAVIEPVVAGITIIGNGRMRPGKRINDVVVKSRRCPGSLGMAKLAFNRELRGKVVRARGCIVFRIMASIASIGRVVIIAIVTSSTIIGNGSMRAFQRIVIVVNRKSGWLPSRGSGMTGSAIGRNIEGWMVRIGRLGIIRIMATVASIGCIGIISVVTTCTVVGNGGVCARERII